MWTGQTPKKEKKGFFEEKIRINSGVLRVARGATAPRANKMLALGVCLPVGMPEHWPQVCRVKITFESLDNLFRFHNNEFDEMPCKMDSTEYAHSFGTKFNLVLRQWQDRFHRQKFKQSASSILQDLSCRFCWFKLSNSSKLVFSKKWKSRIALLVHNLFFLLMPGGLFHVVCIVESPLFSTENAPDPVWKIPGEGSLN